MLLAINVLSLLVNESFFVTTSEHTSVTALSGHVRYRKNAVSGGSEVIGPYNRTSTDGFRRDCRWKTRHLAGKKTNDETTVRAVRDEFLEKW